MSGTADKAKGRAEETVGDLIGDDRLEREGAGGEAKNMIGNVKDWVEDKIDDARGRIG